MLNGRQSLYSIGAQVMIALTCVVCATVLAAMGQIDAAAVTAILGGALGLAGATGAITAQATAAAAAATPTRVSAPGGMVVETGAHGPGPAEHQGEG